MADTVKDRVRGIVREHGRLSGEPADGDDLYRAGMTSHSSVNVMLALENAFDVEFPDELLTRETFQSVDAITLALTGLGAS